MSVTWKGVIFPGWIVHTCEIPFLNPVNPRVLPSVLQKISSTDSIDAIILGLVPLTPIVQRSY